MLKLKARTSNFTEFADAMRNLTPFETHGSLRGTRHRSTFGRLPRAYWDAAAAATYLVFSYDTPIAWRNPDGTWTCPHVKYSVTTSKHQGRIAPAVTILNQESPVLVP